VLDYVSKQRESVQSTRSDLHADTDFIYTLDNLMVASKQSQGIAPGSIHERIIQDYMYERGLVALLEGIALAVVTLALTILSFGTGALAVAAGGAALGLSAWQAVDAFREYVRQSNAADARLLSEDPSIAWLVIAVVGVAVDLGAATAAVRALRPAALALQGPEGLVAFRQAVEALPGVDARIRNAVIRGAEAEASLRGQWRAVMGGIGSRPNDITVALAEGGYRAMVMAWHLARRGFWRFDQYLAELQRMRLIADATGLSSAELRALRVPYDEGLRRVQEGFLDASRLSPELRAALPPTAIDEAAAFGRLLGLDEDEIMEILKLEAIVARTDPDALSPRALQAAMRERAVSSPADELVGDVRGLPESGTRTVDAIEQAYEIGVGEGRSFLEGRGWTQWGHWVNPFEFNGRYGQGLDDVFVDNAGRLWIVEYKGGTAELSPGQMSRDWVRRQIQRLRDAGYDFAAEPLQAALDAGTLRGVVVSTPHGQPATIIQEVPY
jgi:hypothetical protein